MLINDSLLTDVENLFCQFFEKYDECTKYAHGSDYSLTNDFRDLRCRFALHESDGFITDAQRQAYFQWELDYLEELNRIAKTHDSSISYKNYNEGLTGIHAWYEFSMSKEDLFKECLGKAAQFATTYMSANKHSFLEFMVRYGTDALSYDALQELKTTFTNAIDYLEEDVLPKAKKFRESFYDDIKPRFNSCNSDAWNSCTKTLKPLYYEEYQVAYRAYEKLMEINSNDSYAKRLSRIDTFHNFDEFYDEMVCGRNSNSLISIQIIRINCEEHIEEFLSQH